MASDVVETATHCRKGVVETENCENIQRCAALSYSTIGSPSLFVWQPPPKPDHSVLPAIGPETRAPVDLLNTANDEFTHCTYCVAPTAPFVSGGALLIVKPSEAFPKPSKPRFTVGASAVGAENVDDCNAASLTGPVCAPPIPGGRGIRRAGSASRFMCAVAALPGALIVGMSRTAGETS